jgi:hypothetical protein
MKLFSYLEKAAAGSVGVLMLLSFALVPAEQVYASNKQLTVGTGGVTGVYYPVGGAICSLINKNSPKHGLNCTAQSTGGSVVNVNELVAGNLDIGLVQGDIQNNAFRGTQQFARSRPDLRVLFSMYPEAFTVVTRADANIKSFDDLAGKRVNIGEPGSGSRSVMQLLMNEYKWTASTFSFAGDIKTAEMAGALCDNKIDAYVFVAGHPNNSIREAAVNCDVRIVPVEGPQAEGFFQKYSFYPKAVVPGGLYRGNDKNISTFGPRATLVTTAKLPDEVAYQIVKAVFDNFEEFKKLHPSLAYLTKEEMLNGNTAPFHPGAIRYFKEVGLMK